MAPKIDKNFYLSAVLGVVWSSGIANRMFRPVGQVILRKIGGKSQFSISSMGYNAQLPGNCINFKPGKN